MPQIDTAGCVAFAFIGAFVIIMIVAIRKYDKVEDAGKLLTPLVTLLSVILTFYFTKNVTDKRVEEEKQAKLTALTEKKTAESKLQRVVAMVPGLKVREDAMGLLWSPAVTPPDQPASTAPAPVPAPAPAATPEK